MPELDEQLRAWADQVEPVTADEARTRAAEPVVPFSIDGRPRGVFGSPGRRLLVAAAVALLVIGGVVVASQVDEGDTVRVGEQPDQPAPDPTPPAPTAPESEVDPVITDPEGMETTTTRPVPNDILGRPSTWVGVDDRGRLVVTDSDTGEVRVLVELDDPNAQPTSEDLLLGTFPGPIALSPDGQHVYYETCCEPAFGEIFRVPVTGGEPEFVTSGIDPALTPMGHSSPSSRDNRSS